MWERLANKQTNKQIHLYLYLLDLNTRNVAVVVALLTMDSLQFSYQAFCDTFSFIRSLIVGHFSARGRLMCQLSKISITKLSQKINLKLNQWQTNTPAKVNAVYYSIHSIWALQFLWWNQAAFFNSYADKRDSHWNLQHQQQQIRNHKIYQCPMHQIKSNGLINISVDFCMLTKGLFICWCKTICGVDSVSAQHNLIGLQ